MQGEILSNFDGKTYYFNGHYKVKIEKNRNVSFTLYENLYSIQVDDIRNSSIEKSNPRKEEKLGKAPKNIYVCVSNEAGIEEYFGLLSEMPEYMRDNLLSEEENWMATAYRGTDKQFREAKNDSRYHHSSHSAPKYLKEVDLGNYL